jgi:hypothetical protein
VGVVEGVNSQLLEGRGVGASLASVEETVQPERRPARMPASPREANLMRRRVRPEREEVREGVGERIKEGMSKAPSDAECWVKLTERHLGQQCLIWVILRV